MWNGLGLGIPAVAVRKSGGGEPPLPPTLSVNFGVKTRVGSGGHGLNYTGGLPLRITAGNASGHWQIDGSNKLVPKNGAGAYGSAPPVFAGPYVLTVTDETYTSTVTVNIVAAAAHWTVGTTANPDTTTSHQLYNLVNTSGAVNLGDTLFGRDCYYNPGPDAFRYRGRASYSGTGRIKITSENVDTSVDGDGLPNLRHGTRIGALTYDAGVSGDIALPFDFEDVYFLQSGASPIAMLKYTTEGYGVNVRRCRFEYVGTNATYPDALAARGGTSTVVTVEDCLFVNTGRAITLGGSTGSGPATNSIIQRNRATQLKSDFVALGASSVVNVTVQDNYASFFIDAGDGEHRDFIQSQVILAGADQVFGTLQRNIVVNYGPANLQGAIFCDDTIDPYRFTGAVIQNNIIIHNGSNGISLKKFDSPLVKNNTVLRGITSGAGLTTLVELIGSGTGGTIVRNLVIAAPSVAGQAGSPTVADNPVLTYSLAGYQAAMPNYSEADLSSAAKVIAATTPLAGVPALISGATYAGALNPDGNWNAA